MAATQTLGDDVWTHDTAAPKVNDVLNQVAEFLSAVGFKKTLKAIEKEAKGDGFEIDLKAWKKTVEDGSAPALTQLWNQWQAKKGGKEETTEDDSSSASSDSDSSSESESDNSSSEDSDSDSDSEGEGMVVDVKAAVDSDDSSDASSSESEAEEKPKAKTSSSKRKRSPSPSSPEASSSDDSSSSDSDAPPAKKRVVEKKASSASSSDSSSSDSSSSDSSASSDSSSGSDSSSSESESEAPAPKKDDSKKESKKDSKDKKPKKEDTKKEKKSSKSDSNSAASSATLGRDSPVDVVIAAPTTSADSTSAEDSTAGMHPARLAMIDGGKPKPAATAVAVVKDKHGKKQNVPFSRISADQYVDPRLASNAYVPYDYADRAHRDLIVTKGKGFTKEKNKKKRGSYRGGAIDLTAKGFKFDD